MCGSIIVASIRDEIQASCQLHARRHSWLGSTTNRVMLARLTTSMTASRLLWLGQPVQGQNLRSPTQRTQWMSQVSIIHGEAVRPLQRFGTLDR
jgi:hypothetical protein